MDSKEYRRLAGVQRNAWDKWDTPLNFPGAVNIFQKNVATEMEALFTDEEKARYMSEYKNLYDTPPGALFVEIKRKLDFIHENAGILGLDGIYGMGGSAQVIHLKFALIRAGAPMELILKVGPLTFFDMLERHIINNLRPATLQLETQRGIPPGVLSRYSYSQKRKIKSVSKSRKKKRKSHPKTN